MLGLTVLINLDIRRWEAIAPAALFDVQFALPGTTVARLVLTAVYLAARRRHLAPTVRALVRNPSDESKCSHPG